MFIYKYTNKINGKVYIGQTVDLDSRLKSHLKSAKRGNKDAFHCAIRKYGIESFTYEVIDGALSSSELNYKEQHYIHLYNSLAPNGYNLRLGNQPSPTMLRPVIAKCKTTNKVIEYRSVSYCERTLGIPRNTLYEVLNGKREYREINGYYFSYKDSDPVKKVLKVKMCKKIKRICQKTGNVKIYKTANDCKNDGFSPECVRNACQRSKKGYTRKRKTGFRWEYLSE